MRLRGLNLDESVKQDGRLLFTLVDPESASVFVTSGSLLFESVEQVGKVGGVIEF